MTPAEEMRAAARKLRKAAAKATPGPWCYHDGALLRGDAEEYAAFDAGPETAPWPPDAHGWERAGLFYGDPEREPDAAYIALLDPRTGLAFADWLEWAAEEHHFGSLGYRNHCTAPDAALTAARLILKEPS